MSSRGAPKPKERLPFFMNSARLQTSKSYFKTNYEPDEIKDFVLESKSQFIDEEREDFEECANHGYYGIPRYLPLKTATEHDEDATGLEEDSDEVFIREVNKWMGCNLIWLTMKRIFVSTKEYFVKPDVAHAQDLEIGLPLPDPSPLIDENDAPTEIITGDHLCKIKSRDKIEWNELAEIDLASAESDSSLRSVYEDESANIQQYQIVTPDGRNANVVQFSIGGLNKHAYTDACQEAMDFRSLVLSENCASLMWVWNEESCIVLITESSDPCCWSVQQWFRKILSDMALTDSIMIGHPYYWHPTVRRKLRRVMKQFKKLYKIIALRKSLEGNPSAETASDTADSESKYFELMYPRGVTQVTIAGHHAIEQRPSSNTVAEGIVSELCDSWGNYHGLVDQNQSVDYVSKRFFSNPSALTKDPTALQSTTFLSFMDSDGEFISPPGITMVPSLNDLKETDVQSLNYHSFDANVEGDHLAHHHHHHHETSLPMVFGNKPLESRWDDKAFNQCYLGMSSEVNMHVRKKRSKSNRQRKSKQ